MQNRVLGTWMLDEKVPGQQIRKSDTEAAKRGHDKAYAEQQTEMATGNEHSNERGEATEDRGNGKHRIVIVEDAEAA